MVAFYKHYLYYIRWPAVQALLPVAAGLTLISLIMKLTGLHIKY